LVRVEIKSKDGDGCMRSRMARRDEFGDDEGEKEE
jgi:hypothetical protein